MLDFLTKHKFRAHLTAFLLMLLSSIGMLFSMQHDNTAFTWILVAIFATANVLAVWIK